MLISALHSTCAATRVLSSQGTRRRVVAGFCALLASLAISAAGAAHASAAPYTPYYACFHTSGDTFAGTDSTVKLEVRGTNGYTGFFELDTPGWDDFETNQTDCFSFVSHDVGTITSVRVWTSGNKSWKLDWVYVSSETDAAGEWFSFYIWMPYGTTTR
jgi:hypothetical protein